MKKVRYAIGVAAGVVPALGLVTPGASAAAHAPQQGVKTVSLHHSGMAPDTTECTEPISKFVSGPYGSSFGAGVAGNCVVGAVGATGFASSLRIMRTQVFSAHGARVFSARIRSSDSSGRVYFSQHVGVKGRKVCETIFKAKHPYKPIEGPICESV